jgi:hypothetical protein
LWSLITTPTPIWFVDENNAASTLMTTTPSCCGAQTGVGEGSREWTVGGWNRCCKIIPI